MKTFFRNNSYTLILIALSFIFLFVFAEKVQQDSEVEYLEVKVGEGDSLLTIADKYYICHRMSYEEFADWVKRENGLAGSVHAGGRLSYLLKSGEFRKIKL